MLIGGKATVEELNERVHGSSLWHTELISRLKLRTGNVDMFLTARREWLFISLSKNRRPQVKEFGNSGSLWVCLDWLHFFYHYRVGSLVDYTSIFPSSLTPRQHILPEN